jgi:HD superfamily phosphohydrolase
VVRGLRIRDPLYGAIEIPDWLVPVVRSPEVQRLRDVRLMNTATDELAALSDVRRFAHTVGALHLGLLFVSHSQLEARLGVRVAQELLLSTVLHDVATPPFGHVLEYLLTLESGWKHEEFVEELLRGRYRPENRYHNVYFDKPLTLWRYVEELELDPAIIRDTICGRTPAGQAISSQVDLDNVDTAFRMADALGLRLTGDAERSRAEDVVNGMAIDVQGVYFTGGGLTHLERWRQLRRAVYETFLFNEGYLVSQAMLSTACRHALRDGEIGIDEWFLTDEELLRRLAGHKATRDLIGRFVTSDLFELLALLWYEGESSVDDLRNPDVLARIEEDLSVQLAEPCFMHVIREAGALEKPLTVRLSNGGRGELGARSDSTIVTVVTPRRRAYPRARAQALVVPVLESYGLRAACLKPVPEAREIDGQPTLPFV